jgi:hypothetical protein
LQRYGWCFTYQNLTTNFTKEIIMSTQTEIPLPEQFTNQPTHWPRLYFLPQPRYVQRQRAANSPQYNPRPQAEVSHHKTQSKRLSYLQRGIQRLTAARNKAWASLKHLGREVARKLVKWCLLPLALAACFSMVEVSPAELPVDYYVIEDVALIER